MNKGYIKPDGILKFQRSALEISEDGKHYKVMYNGGTRYFANFINLGVIKGVMHH